MYRHILVPLDGSALATELARQSVLLAKSLGAKITFFHAMEGLGSSSVAALERVMWPSLDDEQVAGEAKAMLAKAAVIAREAGVEYETLIARNDRPHAAILQAAESRRCDLIVIASHGRRGLHGLLVGSQTQNVLQQSSLPVLVLAPEANVWDWERVEALAILRDEHRSLAAVAHGLELLAREARTQGALPRFDLLRAIVRFIREFPEKQHHPKEDAYLFRRLRGRTSEFDDTLEELERQHVAGAALIDELEQSIDRYEADLRHGYEPFAEAVARFVASQESHMRLESRIVFPAAYRHLTPADWDEIGRAFAENGDPRFSADTDEELRHLFVRILNVVPESNSVSSGQG